MASVAGSGASAAIALVDGRYLMTTTSDKNAAGMASLCDVSQMLTSGSGLSAGTTSAAKGPVSTIDGTQVLELKGSDGSGIYVTDTSRPELVQAFAPKGARGGSGKLTFTVNAPVTLTAPPASQVIDGSQLGF
jgi:hypothetical protein